MATNPRDPNDPRYIGHHQHSHGDPFSTTGRGDQNTQRETPNREGTASLSGHLGPESRVSQSVLNAEASDYLEEIIRLETLILSSSRHLSDIILDVDRLSICLAKLHEQQYLLEVKRGRAWEISEPQTDRIREQIAVLLTGVARQAKQLSALAEPTLVETVQQVDVFNGNIPPPIDNQPARADDSPMEPRVKRLEDFAESARGELRTIDVRLGKIETRLEGIDKSIAALPTKGDLGQVESTLLRWFVGTAIAMVGLAFAAAKLIHP